MTAPGGEIDVLDPAGYGSLVIDRAISIVNDGVGIAGVQAGAGISAITINAGLDDIVHLRGLTVEGAGVAAHGILFNSGAALDIVNCVVRHFNQNGIYLVPSNAGTSYFTITNTFVADNAGVGIWIQPSGNQAFIYGVVNGVTVKNNYDGVLLDSQNSTADKIHVVTVVNSVAFNNRYVGFYSASTSGHAYSYLELRGVTTNLNGHGVQADGPGGYYAVIDIARSNIGHDGLVNNGGTVYTYGDNDITGFVTGTLTPKSSQ
jgi:hypothetical protein